MSDRSWALNSSILIVARSCIKLVEQEFGVKLRLSNENFLTEIGEYAKRTRSSRTVMLCSKLAVMTGSERQVPMQSAQQNEVPVLKTNVTPIKAKVTTDRVEYCGKQYSRFNEHGEEFRGLYRGQARYA